MAHTVLKGSAAGLAGTGAMTAHQESLRSRARLSGSVFAAGVWAASYVQLVPLGIYEPPWRYPLGSLADEIGYHLTYGATVAKAYELISAVLD